MGWRLRVNLRRRDCRTLVVLFLSVTVLTCVWISLLVSSSTPPDRRTSRFAPNSTTYTDRQHQRLDQHEQVNITRNVDKTGSSASRSSSSSRDGLSLREIVFGIAGSATLWPERKELLRLWWRPPEMRGHVWHEDQVKPQHVQPEDVRELPGIRISEDTSSFRYTNHDGDPAGIRLARILLETMRLGLEFKWLVLCDDDTIFSVDNLVRVLNNYDPSRLFYIGSLSESHGQNVAFSHRMAFGGGGIAISYPLAKELAAIQDACLKHYPDLTGSDDRVQACMSELGVQLTREPGFHQMDIRGNPLGLLSAHPVAPFVSMHHMNAMDPVFPEKTRLQSLRILVDAMKSDPSNFLQQTIGYDHGNQLTFSISTGYVVQVFQRIIYPRVLEKAEITFKPWNPKRRSVPIEFDVDTRKVNVGPASLFFLSNTYVDMSTNQVVSEYRLYNATSGECSSKDRYCWAKMLLSPAFFNKTKPLEFQVIRVFTRPLSSVWYKTPRRQCCHVGELVNGVLNITVSPCQAGETLVKS